MPSLNHQEYVADRIRREPRFQEELAAAGAELALGGKIVHRRHEQQLSLAQVSEATGISGDRLEAIEEGDSLTFHEVLWLLHALDLSVSIDSQFRVMPQG